MIQLTRLRHDDVFFLNPDLVERVDTHVDTMVRLTNGNEYIVAESAEEILRLIAEFRAKVLALVPVVRVHSPAEVFDIDVEPADYSRGPRPPLMAGEVTPAEGER